jgi:uncharacterized protein (TIRG00374 family)
LLVLLTLAVGPRRLGAALETASPSWLAVLLAGSLVWLMLGALNVWLLLRRLAPVTFRAYLPVYLKSWLLAQLLPTQLGDASQVLLLRTAGVPVGSSGAAYLLDKALSLAWLGLVAACGIALYTPYRATIWLLSLVAIGALGLAGVAILGRATTRSSSWLHRGRVFVASTIEQILIFRKFPWSVVRNLGLTVVKWALTTGLYLSAFRAVGAPIGIAPAATIPFMSSLVGYVPVTVAGAGTMELTAVLLFRSLGIDGASVLSVFLLVRCAVVVVALVLLLGFQSRALAGERDESSH